MLILGIFPIAMAAIGLSYIFWAWQSLTTGRIRTLPKTYVDKVRFPVTYRVLFLSYWAFGLLAVLFAIGIVKALFFPT